MKRKKIISMLLAATLTVALVMPAFAEGGTIATWLTANQTEETGSVESQNDSAEDEGGGFFASLFSSDTSAADESGTENTEEESTALATAEGSVTSDSSTEGEEYTTSAAQRTMTLAEGTGTELKLWYDEPAASTYSSSSDNEVWERATLPIGNGIIGANVYGELATEHLTVNEETLWSGGRGSVENYNGGNPSESKVDVYNNFANTLLADGTVTNIEALAGVAQADSGYNYGYQALGDLYFAFADAPTTTPDDYVRALDLENGEATVSYTNNGTTYTRTYFTSNPNNVLVSRLTASAAMGDITVSFVSKQTATPAAEVSSNKGYITVSGTVANNGLLHDTQLAVVADDGTVTANADGTVTVSGATAVTVYLTSATDYENTFYDDNQETTYYYRTGETADELNARVKAVLDQAVTDGYDTVLNAHRTDYQAMFNRVTLDLGQSNDKTTDALLTAYQNDSASDAEKRYMETLMFQYGRYLLIAGSRENSQLPTTLQGIWNNSNNAPWYSDIHTNINIQMNYWLSNACNLTECALPLVEYVKNLAEPGGRTVEIYTGATNGIMAHTQNTPFGYTSPGYEISTWGWSPAAATWMMQNCYDYYEYSEDIDTLRNDIYPILREQVLMYEELLKDYNGRKVMPIALSPELSPITAGNTYEQSLIWQLYSDTIEAAKVLGEDDDLIAGWQATMEALDPIEIGDSGQVKEWYTETTINSVADTSSHRHLSNLLGLYPGNLFDTEELEQAAIVSLNNKNFGRVGTSSNPDGGWTYGQLINSWARVNDGENAYYSIEQMIKNRLYQNLWDYHSPDLFQIDANYGYSAGVAEMLLQSNLGYIEMLPALPEAWATGSVNGLLAEGNFEVDMTWAGGALTTASVLSNNGGDCAIVAAEGTRLAITDETTGTEVTATEADGIYTFSTTAGTTYSITSEEIPEVENLTAVRNDDGTVTLNWTAKTDVTYTVSLVAEDGTETELEKGLTEGTYTHADAVADTDYVYKVVGSDGSTSTVSTDLTDIVGKVYVKYTETEQPPAGDYVIATAARITGSAIGNTRTTNGNLIMTKMDIIDDRIRDVEDAYVWNLKITDADNGYYSISNVGKSSANESSYLELKNVNLAGGLEFANQPSDWKFTYASDTENSWAIGNTDSSGFINSHKDSWTDSTRGAGTYTSGTNDTGSRFYLFGEKYYTVQEDAIEELTANVGDRINYSEESWEVYTEALADARGAYNTEEEVLPVYEALEAAVNGLVPMVWNGMFDQYYQKVVPTTSDNTDTSVQEVPSGDYLIVGSGNYAGKAITTNGGLTYTDVTVSDDTITPLNKELEWKFTWTGSGYTVESVDDAGCYLYFSAEDSNTGVTISRNTPQSIQLDYLNGNGNAEYAGTLHIGGVTVGSANSSSYLNNRGGGIGSYNGSYGWPDTGSSFFLYREVVEIPAATITAATANVGEASAYTTDSWNEYQEALTAAGESYGSAEEAYIAYIDLLEAVNDLVAIDIPDYITEAYVKISPDFDKENPVEDGTYVIVGANVGYSANKLVNSEYANGGLTYTSDGLTFTMNNNRVSPLSDVYEWKFIRTADGVYMVVAADDGSYMSVTDSGVSLSADAVDIKIIAPNSTYATTGAMCIGNGTWWLNHQTNVKTWNDNDGGSSYYLYERVFVVDSTKLTEITNAVGTDSTRYTAATWAPYQEALTAAEASFATADAAYAAYQALETAQDALKFREEYLYETICNANPANAADATEKKYLFDESAYTADTWATYITALEAAKAGAFANDTTADEKITALEAAVQALELAVLKASYADITWEITEHIEEVENPDGTTTPNYIKDLNYVNHDAAYTYTESGVTYPQYEALIWNWEDDLSRLVNDEDSKVDLEWTPHSTNGMSSKVFNNKTEKTWYNANVYKISGTFTWPDDYDLQNTILVLESANDYYYYDIYKYLEENSLEDLFPLGKVLPVNDDVYVVMWAGDDADKPTVDTINDYMPFWSGTSGKGIWSQLGNTSNDYKRTTPATFLDYSLQSERSFYQSYPNAVGTGLTKADGTDYTNADVKGFDFYYTKHTDWYALSDTTSVNSVLRNNYDSIDAGTEVHIDLYVFNNSETGVIDELELQLIEEHEDYVDVKVEYYLETAVGDEIRLGEEKLLQHKANDQITLLPGTIAGQLNSYKAQAITDAKTTNVSDGVQQGTIPFVVTEDAANNVIKVVYTVQDQPELTLTAESAEVLYNGSDYTLNEVTITEKGYDGTATLNDASGGKYTLPDNNTIENVHSVVTQSAPGIYENNFTLVDGTTMSYVVKNSLGVELGSDFYKYTKNPGTLKITTNTVEETFTYDFGVTNSYTDVLKTDAAAGVAEGLATSVTADKDNVELDLATNTLTYTPDGVNTGETVTLTLEYTGGYTVEKIVNLVPASNVFYEENFADITGDGNDATAASWTTDGTAGSKTVTDNDSTVYGYTAAYDETVVTHSNSSALKATLSLTDGTGIEGTTAKTLDAVTFTFTGTGFDLISKCGTDTGMLLVKVVGAAGTTKAYLVDTYFTGDTSDSDLNGDGEVDENDGYITSGNAAYQVPVIREMDLTYDTYTVTVYGYLVNTAGAMTATYSMDDSAPAVPVEDILMIALEDCGMSDIDTSEVEVTYMDDNSVLNGGSGNVYADSGIGTFALDAADESSDTTEGTDTATTDTAYVYVDGFRVYQPLTDETAYTEDEQGVKYASLFEYLKTSANDLETMTDNTALYVEYDGALGIASVADYQNYGPENEVYLTGQNAVVFGLVGYQDGDTVQVSAKTVYGEAMLNEAVVTNEMYYDVTGFIEEDKDLGIHYVIIQNQAEETGGILALSGLKISSNIGAMASAELGEKVEVQISETENAFVPETLDITASSSARVGRSFTIRANSSTNVEKLEIVRVNPETGEEETPVEVKASNTKAVAAGKADLYKYSKSFKETAVGDYTYRVYVYGYVEGQEGLVKSNAYEVTISVVNQQ